MKKLTASEAWNTGSEGIRIVDGIGVGGGVLGVVDLTGVHNSVNSFS